MLGREKGRNLMKFGESLVTFRNNLIKQLKSICLVEIVWLNIITNKIQNVCLHTGLILVQTSFYPYALR
jgi:hypothetical protein